MCVNLFVFLEIVVYTILCTNIYNHGVIMHKSLKPKYQLRYTKLSKCTIEEALPLGNGKMGAMALCGARNDSTTFVLSSGIYGGTVGVLPDVSDKIKEVRKLASANNQMMAGLVIENALENKKYKPTKDKLMSIVKINLEHTNAGKISSYTKSLTMDNEEVCVCYNAGGVKVERSSFVSFKDNLYYQEISKTGTGLIDFEISLSNGTSDREQNLESETTEVSASILTYEKVVEGKVFGLVVRVLTDLKAGVITMGNVLRIENAEKIVLVAEAYTGKVKDKLQDKIKTKLLALKQVSYEKAFKEHYGEYVKKWGKSELSLGGKNSETVDGLVENVDSISKMVLAEKLFHYAKYLMLTGVNDSFEAPFSQGLFNLDSTNSGLLDFSVSLPSLYSAAFLFGDLDKVNGVLCYIKQHQDDLKKCANRLFKAAGFMVPTSVVYGSMLPAETKASSLYLVMAGASISRLYYEYFLYTKDIKFLTSTAVPFITSVLEFYMNYFYKLDDGSYESLPSFAPFSKTKFYENREEKVQKNSTCDFFAALDVAKIILDIGNIYSLPIAKLVEYQKFYNDLSKINFIYDGMIKEHLSEDVNSCVSSGVMHLYPLYTKNINFASNEEELAPFVQTIKAKLGAGLTNQRIISLAKLLSMCACIGKADLFDGLFGFMVENYLSSNFIFLNQDKYNLCKRYEDYQTFNLPANMEVASGIISSIIMSSGNNIYILPAKPSDWQEGELSGVYLSQNVIASVSFDDRRGSMQISLKAIKNTKFNLILFKGVKKVKGITNFNPINPCIENISILAGKTITYDIKY